MYDYLQVDDFSAHIYLSLPLIEYMSLLMDPFMLQPNFLIFGVEAHMTDCWK